jgi:glycosyltransferase involved in cell wall biosynthesis
MTPLCSYIIPSSRITTNWGWVEKAVNSARSQTIKDIEILVLDSTCSDRDFGDRRVRVFNRYLPVVESMNYLIEQAKSDVMLLLCDDDFDEPNRAEVVLNNIYKYDIFAGSFNRIEEDGRFINTVVTDNFDYNNFLFNGLSTPICAGGFRKSKCSRFSNRFPMSNDYYMILQSVLSGCSVGVTSEVLSNFRVHFNQLSGGSRRNHITRIEEKKEIFDILGVK